MRGSFTISVPSWVIPGTYLENLRFLLDKPVIQGVELLLFIYDEQAKGLFRKEWPEISAYVERFSFSLHMPDVPAAEHAEIIELTSNTVKAYVVHPRPPEEAEAEARLLQGWIRDYGPVFRLENTYDGWFEAVHPLLGGIDLCVDTGHLLLRGLDPAAYVDRHGQAVRELHFHGVRDGRDHLPPGPEDGWPARLGPFLEKFDGTLDFEVFSWTEVKACLAAVDSVLQP